MPARRAALVAPRGRVHRAGLGVVLLRGPTLNLALLKLTCRRGRAGEGWAGCRVAVEARAGPPAGTRSAVLAAPNRASRAYAGRRAAQGSSRARPPPTHVGQGGKGGRVEEGVHLGGHRHALLLRVRGPAAQAFQGIGEQVLHERRLGGLAAHAHRGAPGALAGLLACGGEGGGKAAAAGRRVGYSMGG